MAQFDVYANPDPDTSDVYPYLVDLQHALLDVLGTTVVAPLVRGALSDGRISRLNPAFVIEGRDVFLSVQELAGVSRAGLGEVVTSVASRRDDIVASLDLLFTGI